MYENIVYWVCGLGILVALAALIRGINTESSNNQPAVPSAQKHVPLFEFDVPRLQMCEEFQDWLCRSREQGGMGMPADLAARRALAIRFIVDGMALRAAREPGLDPDELRATLQDMLGHLLS